MSKQNITRHRAELQNQKGISLIELLVVASIFIIISGAVSGLLISGIKGQRHTLASRQLLDQTSFAMEYMSRALRMAKKDTTDDLITCLSVSGLNYEIINNALRFINHLEEDDCQEFFLDTTDPNAPQLKQRKGIGTPDAIALVLTSKELYVEDLQFNLIGESEVDSLQPRVTVAITIRDNTQKSGEQPEIKIQTTLSQRNLDE